jgi:hypothetical protein
MAKTCRLNCHVKAGMFSDEYVASVPAMSADGSSRRDVHLFVDRGCLEKLSGDRAQLRAVKVGTTRGGVAVVLPQPTFETGPSVLVPREVLAR